VKWTAAFHIFKLSSQGSTPRAPHGLGTMHDQLNADIPAFIRPDLMGVAMERYR
jgi:hypothetical protein